MTLIKRVCLAAIVLGTVAGVTPDTFATDLALDEHEGLVTLNSSMEGAVQLAGGARLLARNIWANSSSGAAIKAGSAASTLVADQVYVHGNVSLGNTEAAIQHVHVVRRAGQPNATTTITTVVVVAVVVFVRCRRSIFQRRGASKRDQSVHAVPL